MGPRRGLGPRRANSGRGVLDTPGGHVLPPLFLFSGGGVFPFPRPPDFFGPGRAFFPRSAPLFSARRAARFPPVTREPRMPPGGMLRGPSGDFPPIPPDFSRFPGRFRRLSGDFRAFPRISHGIPPGARKTPGLSSDAAYASRGAWMAGGKKNPGGGDPGIMAPPHSSDASRAASIFAAFAAAAALWASLAGALHDTSFAGHSK